MTLEEILAQLEQLATITDTAELDTLEAAIVELYQELRSQDDLSEEDVSALRELAEARTAVQDRIAAIATQAAELDTELADLDAVMSDTGDGEGEGDDGAESGEGEGDEADGDEGEPGDGEADEAGEGDEGEGDGEAETEGAGERELVTASIGQSTRRRLQQVQGRQPRRQREPATLGSDVVTASVGVPGHFAEGARITTAEQFGRAMAARHEAVGTFSGGPGDPFQKFPVLTVRREFESDLVIGQRFNAEQVTEVMDRAVDRHIERVNRQVAAMGDDVVLAAGGPCVDAEPDYRVEFVGSDTRPFSQAYPTVRYPRGRVQYYPPLCFDGADADTTFAEIGRAITQAQDEGGYSDPAVPPGTTPKGCVRIDCPDSVGCGLEILIKCMTIGNWVDRTFPEYVRAWQQLIDVYYARAYEQRHIAQVVAGSEVVTDAGSPFGASLSLSAAVLTIIAHNNSARRTPNRAWRLILPSWAITLLKIDLMRYLNATANGLSGLNVSDAQVVTMLRNLGVNVSTYIDEAGPTTQGDDQLLSLITSGAVPALPLSVRAILHPEGQWVRGTGGELSTGIIRDSALIQSNDFQTFFEEWTSMCQRGCAGDSYVLDAAVCPSGVAGGTVVMDCFDESA